MAPRRPSARASNPRVSDESGEDHLDSADHFIFVELLQRRGAL
jgi:hypothetical protein